MIVSFSMLLPAFLGAFPGTNLVVLENFKSGVWQSTAQAYCTKTTGTDGSGSAMRIQFKGTARILPPRTLILPAQAVNFKLNVAGSGRRDRLFAVFQDAYGVDRTVFLGLTDFAGLRVMSVNVAALPQAAHLDPRGLVLRWLLIVPASPGSIQIDSVAVEAREWARLPQ